MKRLTIKMRVTLWYTLLMLMMVLLCLTVLFGVGKKTILENSRQALTAAVTSGIDEIEYDEEDRAIEIEEELDFYQQGIYLAVYSGDGMLLAGYVPSVFPEGTALVSGQFQTAGIGGGEWYYYDQMRELPGYGAIWVRGIMPADSTEQTFGTLYQIALIGLPFIVLFAAIGGYLIAWQAFRPVAQITAAAERINEGKDLSLRIGLGKGRDEIYTLAQTFDRMFDRLQAAFESEKQFTSDASHELRTPTAVIIAQCEYALEEAKTLEEAQQALGNILDQAQRMSALIAQLLTLARADKGHEKLVPELINLSELAEIIALQQQENADKKQIIIETDIEPDLLIHADETMMMRMLINLMENGIRYGRDGGFLKLSLHKKPGCLEGMVEDNGIGIAPEHLDKIWDRFYQIDPARSRADGSSGLGLSMVKWIVQAHGGTVAVSSDLERGSCFTFTLPV